MFVPDETLTLWNITLRDDVLFHDGSKFSADDVIFTINKIQITKTPLLSKGVFNNHLYFIMYIKILHEGAPVRLRIFQR